MGEKLNRAGHGVGTVESALGAADDLDLVDIVKRKAHVIEVAARFVGRSAVDEYFCVIRIAAIEKQRGQSSNRAGAGDGDSGLRVEEIWQGDGLALFDLFVGE